MPAEAFRGTEIFLKLENTQVAAGGGGGMRPCVLTSSAGDGLV